MTPDQNGPLNHTDLFVDSSHRVAAVSATREFQKAGYLPDTFTPQPSDVTKLEVVEPNMWYVVRYQASDFGPTVLAGVDTLHTTAQRKFVQLQALIYPQDQNLISVTLNRSIPLGISDTKDCFAFLMQVFGEDGYLHTHMGLSYFPTDRLFIVTHDTFSPLGIVRDVQLDHKGTILPELPNWPDNTISQAALRLLDEARLIKLFQVWPTTMSPNWGDLSTTEAMHELSQRIIQQH